MFHKGKISSWIVVECKYKVAWEENKLSTHISNLYSVVDGTWRLDFKLSDVGLDTYNR